MKIYTSARRHLFNVLLNFGGHFLNIAVMFFLTPFIVGHVDRTAYGLWGIINTVFGYMGLLDLGVRASVGRHVALYLGKGDREGVEGTIQCALAFFSLLFLVVLLFALGVGRLGSRILRDFPEVYERTTVWLLLFMGVNFWIAAISTVFSSLLAGYDRFDLIRLIDVVALSVKTLVTVVTLSLGFDLWGLAMGVCAGNIVAMVGNLGGGIRIHPMSSIVPKLDGQRLRELLGYGVGAFIMSSAVKLIGQTDILVVGLLVGVGSVREYSVGMSVVMYAATLLTIATRTLFPAMQRSMAVDSSDAPSRLFRGLLMVTICVGAPIFVGEIFFARDFIGLWMFQENFGTTSIKDASEVMTILAVAAIPLVWTRPLAYVLAAEGSIWKSSTVTAFEAVGNLLLSLVFVIWLGFGLRGVALGTLVARYVIGLPLLIIVFIYTFRSKGAMLRSLAGASAGGLLCGGVFAALCLGVRTWVAISDWSRFWGVVGGLAAAWGVLMVLWLKCSGLASSLKKPAPVGA